MNLLEIRNKVLVQHNYVPNSTTYFGYVNNTINEAYVELFTSRAWSFNQKTIDYLVWPDVDQTTSGLWLSASTAGAHQTGSTCQVALNSRAFYLTNSADLAGQLYPNYIGNQISLDGYDYTISAVTNWNTSTGSERGMLEEPFAGNTSNALTDWTIKHNYYSMPWDLAEILDISFRDNRNGYGDIPGKIVQIPRRMDSNFAFSYQETADKPACYIPAEETAPIPPPTVGPTMVSGALNPALGAGFAADETVKVAYTYSYSANGLGTGGKSAHISFPESAMSPTSSITVANSGTLVTLTVPNQVPEGMQINWYLAVDNEGVDNRTFYLPIGGGYVSGSNALLPEGYLQGSNTEAGGTFSIYPQAAFYPKPPYGPRFHNTNGRLKRIRFYPRPQGSADYIGTLTQSRSAYSYFQLRYIYRPTNLEFDTDVPVFPEEFHYLLIDRVLVDLYNREGKLNQAAIHQRKYDERYKFLLARYGTERDFPIQRRGAWNRSAFDPSVIYPNPVIYRGGSGGGN